MRIIISPAKKMRVDTDTLPYSNMPRFLERAEILKEYLQGLSREEAQTVWKCSDRLAELNYERHQHMNLHKALTPAILCYEGIQYQYMAPAVFEQKELAYIEEHLRILSGFYGLLRPFDGVVPYRLEMQARIDCNGFRTLYEFWQDRLAKQIFEETDCVINLASKEYSMCISKYVPSGAKFITCIFGELTGGKVKEKGTLCKMARGEMVKYMAEQCIERPEEIRNFAGLGFRFREELSDKENFMFVREEMCKKRC